MGLLMGAALALSACGKGPPPAQEAAVVSPPVPAANPAADEALAKQAQQEENKKVVAAFFREGITTEERYDLLHPDYIQHNPLFRRFGEINKAKGREEFKLLMTLITQGKGGMRPPAPPAGATPPPPGEFVHIVMADGDLVTVLQKRYSPDPQNKGQYYESFWFDTWRVKEGKLYEHWDAMTIPDKVPELLKGPAKVE
jgi:predicted SnoaL-like aldol condensation-catalyzing enzyme